MRTTFFNEPVFQPGDDFLSGWLAKFEEEPEAPVARFLEEDDDDMNGVTFGCEITDNNEHTAFIEGYPSVAELRSWLASNEIKIED